jgi:2-(3-amino-3-carboxypropyl)histidine synthase
METYFIPVIVKKEPDYSKITKLINEKILERKIAICYSNQFIEIAKKLEKELDKEIIFKTQVLGCSRPAFPKEVEAILIIGQGKFHSVSLAYESKLPTYILEDESIEKINEKDVLKLEKRERGAYLKYLNSKKVGILISTKPGQQRLNKSLEFKQGLKEKKSYLFIGNDLNVSEFENFGIDCWVNSACPRMDLTEGSVINMGKII